MAVEFALVAPMILFLLTMVVDVGLAFNDLKRLELAAETGLGYARHAPNDVTGIRAAALNATGDDAQRLSVTVDEFCACMSGAAISCTGSCVGEDFPASYVRVTVASSFSGLFNLIPVADAFNMSSNAVGRVQ